VVNIYFIYGIGFLAQALFGSRMIIQWIQSERAGYVVSPTLFWKTSLVASALFIIYGLLRQDAVIIFGQLLSYFIYIRNLQLKKEWQLMSLYSRISFLLLPFFILIFALSYNISLSSSLNTTSANGHLFVFISGSVGQLLLNLRFVYQWYYSEKRKTSILPLGFWIISVIGALLTVTYSLFRFDPVLFLAQTLGVIIYTRNVMLYIRSPQKSEYHGVKTGAE